MNTITTLYPTISSVKNINSYDIFLWCNQQSPHSYEDIITAIHRETLDDISILYDVFTWITCIPDETLQLQTLIDIMSFNHVKNLTITKKYTLIAHIYSHAMNMARMRIISWCYSNIEYFLHHPTIIEYTKMYYRFTFGNKNPHNITDKQCSNQLEMFFNYGGTIVAEDVYTALCCFNLKLASLLIKTFTQYRLPLNSDKITELLANPKLKYLPLEKKRVQVLLAKRISTL